MTKRLNSCKPGWQALESHHQQLAAEKVNLRTLFNEDPVRFQTFSLNAAGIFLDYSKNLITQQTLELFKQVAEENDLQPAIKQLFNGDIVNQSEQRPALHTALRNRSQEAVMVNGHNIMPEIRATQAQMRRFVDRVRSGNWLGYSGKIVRHVVNIGIGGSFLGPKLVAEGLHPYWNDSVHCHFLANIDGSEFHQTLKHCQAENTLFIVTSKSFGTMETLKNAQAAKQWYLSKGGDEKALDKHFVAVTSNVNKAQVFGIHPENIFPMWDWVGGRYSLWSAVGLPLALAIGMDNFDKLLDGAYAMDQHFHHAPLNESMPFLLAMLQTWNSNFLGARSQAIIPYDHYLRGLPAHLQQLEMESNGKRVSQSGEDLACQTGAVIWGGEGTNGQHAYHQLLHQGTQMIPVDFIVPLKSHHPINEHHDLLFACCLSQSQALMAGKSLAECEAELRQSGLDEDAVKALAPHKVIPGNRPSNTLVVEKITPESMGALIALYEHKVFCQSVIWGTNAFDQWGVELGKQLGDTIYKTLQQNQSNEQQDKADFDASTQGLINRFLAAKRSQQH